jgi:DNA transformation protein and related proteins
MPRRSEFVDYLVESLAGLGDVQARAMFGGWGFYLHGRMFALVAFDTFYIKADDENRADFESRGLAPFRYEAGGKVSVMSYFQPPSAALDDRDLLCEWARRGVEAAARSAKTGPRRKLKGGLGE